MVSNGEFGGHLCDGITRSFGSKGGGSRYPGIDLNSDDLFLFIRADGELYILSGNGNVYRLVEDES